MSLQIIIFSEKNTLFLAFILQGNKIFPDKKEESQ